MRRSAATSMPVAASCRWRLPLLPLLVAAAAAATAPQPGAILRAFEYPDHLCGVAWRDDYTQLHARIRAASRDAWQLTQAEKAAEEAAAAGAPSSAPSPSPAPAPPSASRRRLQDPSASADPAAASDAPAVRFMTYDWYGTCGGLGDYLVGLASLFPIAVLDRRALLLAQPCMHSAFLQPYIQTNLSPDVPMGAPLVRAPMRARAPAAAPGGGAAGDHTGGASGDADTQAQAEADSEEWHAPECARVEKNLTAVVNASEVPCFDFTIQGFDLDHFQRYSTLSNYRVKYNHGLLITALLHDKGPWADGFREMGFKVPYAFGCILRFLFRPRPEVWQLVAGLEEELWGEGVVRVGVHVRVDDDQVWSGLVGEPLQLNASQLGIILLHAAPTLQCAQAVEDFWLPPPLRVKWLLLSNSQHLKQALKAQYPDKVVITDFTPWHSETSSSWLDHGGSNEGAFDGRHQFLETVAEWVLMASCHSFVIPASGFSRTAALYSLRPLDIFMPPPDPCIPEEPTPIASFSGSWSGI